MLPYVVTIIGLMFVGTTTKDSKEKVKKLKEIKGESI
jgi:ABC-type uncharacterized transport system permease subunit